MSKCTQSRYTWEQSLRQQGKKNKGQCDLKWKAQSESILQWNEHLISITADLLALKRNGLREEILPVKEGKNTNKANAMNVHDKFTQKCNTKMVT